LCRRLVSPRDDFSIVSDYCWGGQIYQVLNRPYASPFVGLWVGCDTYLDLIESLPQALERPLEFEPQSTIPYPVARLGGARLGFKHYPERDQAEATFRRRALRFNPKRVFFKIDFRSEWYTAEDVRRWNRLNLPLAIAFTDASCERFGVSIHHALELPPRGTFRATVVDSLNAFRWWTWLTSGVIRPHNAGSRRINRCLLDS
jgi:uncharacterized protein (DUF1919 family)